MIRTRIKEETMDQHKALEAISYSSQIMDYSITEDKYRSLIRTNYISNKAFENAWSNLDFEVPKSLMLEHRVKVKSLEADLKELGEEVPDVSGISFPVNSYPEFMGCLYVFEGSTLGGAVIHKALKKNENLNNIENFHFYNCYGERLGMMWGIFLEHLTQIEDVAQVDAAIEAARNTFTLVHHITEKDKVGSA